jgi:hypothetical protein
MGVCFQCPATDIPEKQRCSSGAWARFNREGPAAWVPGPFFYVGERRSGGSDPGAFSFGGGVRGLTPLVTIRTNRIEIIDSAIFHGLARLRTFENKWSPEDQRAPIRPAGNCMSHQARSGLKVGRSCVLAGAMPGLRPAASGGLAGFQQCTNSVRVWSMPRTLKQRVCFE